MKSQLYLWSRQALYVGRSFDSQEHIHHAVQLSIGLDGPLRLNKGTKEERLLSSVIINSETRHSLLVEGQWVASLYLEPESGDYERIVDYFSAGQTGGFKEFSVEEELKIQFSDMLGTGASPSLAKQLVQKLIGSTEIEEAQSLDPRIVKVLRYLDQSQGVQVPLEQLAKHVSLSPDRLAHLF